MFARLKLEKILSNRNIIVSYLVMMCVQIVAIEGYIISPVKVAMMAIAPLLFIIKSAYVTQALVWGIAYWAWCLFSAMFNGGMRFSTIGYLGMFVVTYIVFYCMLYRGALSFEYFTKLVRVLIMLFGIVLILQQIAMLLGLSNLPFINLTNQHFLSVTKLPSLTLEPSHSARVLSLLMLCHLRCLELVNGQLPTIKELFSPNNRWVSILFLWTMLSMGSGTAFIGLGILSLYFIRRKTVVYIIPLLAILLYVAQAMELSQMDRAMRIATATTTGDVMQVREADSSGATRVIPLINTLFIDLTKKESWVGKGTSSREKVDTLWKSTTNKIAVVEQYGLIALILSFTLVYTCAIKSFFSIETLFFLLLLGASLGNIAYVWGAMMLFTCVRYFQETYINNSDIFN